MANPRHTIDLEEFATEIATRAKTPQIIVIISGAPRSKKSTTAVRATSIILAPYIHSRQPTLILKSPKKHRLHHCWRCFYIRISI
jgi:hypothetical protein